MRLWLLPPILALTAQSPTITVKTRTLPTAPVATLNRGGAPQRALVEPRFGDVKCIGGDTPALVTAPRLPVELGWMTARFPSVTLRFEIDATGRPHQIELGDGEDYDGGVQAALAAARFAPGIAKGCTVTLARRSTAIDTAPRPLLVEALFFAGPEPVLIDRLFGTGPTNCREVPPPRVQRFPVFDDVPQPAGSRGWTLLGYDLDAKGSVRDAHVEASSGNAALDRAGLRALATSRFQAGPRQGCLFRYWRNSPEPLAAPEKPPRTAFELSGTCPKELDARWLGLPNPRFPEGFRRRGIEGWAVVSFDVAPWGQPGNIRVLNAEPAAAFGEAAKRGVELTRMRVDGDGYRGCVEHFRFRMGKPGESERVHFE